MCLPYRFQSHCLAWTEGLGEVCGSGSGDAPPLGWHNVVTVTLLGMIL